MKTLKYFKQRIRGWIPKELSFPSPQKTKNVEVNQKAKKPTKTSLALYAIGIFVVGFIALSILEALGLGPYTPFAGGAVMALIAGVLSVLLLKPRNQSSKSSEINKHS
jgi:quinol-cytochrome oxidoreductase complex cytochrome b subunit